MHVKDIEIEFNYNFFRVTKDEMEENGIIGIFLHIFYTDLARKIFDLCLNIKSEKMVYISTDTIEKSNEIQIFLLNHELARSIAEIRVCPNVGYDIAPFLVGFSDKIMGHKIILHLHTKKSLHIEDVNAGAQWRELLYSSLVGNSEIVNCIIKNFCDNKQIGLIAPPSYPALTKWISVGSNQIWMNRILSSYNLSVVSKTPVDFPVGSMFWARSEVLSPWLNLGLKWSDFDKRLSKSGQRSLLQDEKLDLHDGTLAHALERCFFYGCMIQKMGWARPTIEEVLKLFLYQKNNSEKNDYNNGIDHILFLLKQEWQNKMNTPLGVVSSHNDNFSQRGISLWNRIVRVASLFVVLKAFRTKFREKYMIRIN